MFGWRKIPASPSSASAEPSTAVPISGFGDLAVGGLGGGLVAGDIGDQRAVQIDEALGAVAPGELGECRFRRLAPVLVRAPPQFRPGDEERRDQAADAVRSELAEPFDGVGGAPALDVVGGAENFGIGEPQAFFLGHARGRRERVGDPAFAQVDGERAAQQIRVVGFAGKHGAQIGDGGTHLAHRLGMAPGEVVAGGRGARLRRRFFCGQSFTRGRQEESENKRDKTGGAGHNGRHTNRARAGAQTRSLGVRKSDD